MKRNIYHILALLLFVFIAISCREDELNENGLLRLNIGIKDKVTTVTRSLSDETLKTLKENCKIRIYSGKGLVRKYNGIGEMPEELQLATGDYSIKVTAGDSVAAAFDKIFYRGEETFNIIARQATSVDVECHIANTLVKVEFGKSLTQAFQSYEVQIASTEGSLTFTSDNEEAIGYYMMPIDNNQLTWTFKATTLSGNNYTRSNTLDVLPATRYDLIFGYEENGDSYIDGGASLTLDINTEPLETTTVEVPVYRRPSISGDGFTLEDEQFIELNKGTAKAFWIATSSILTKALITCDQFKNIGLPVNSFDIVSMSKEDKELFATNYGVTINSKYNVNTGQGNAKIAFSDIFMAKMSQTEGVYDIYINATDDNKLQRTSLLRFIVSDATVVTTNVVEADVWATKSTLRATLAKETTEALAFKYRIKGTTNELTVPAQRVSDSKLLYANIAGLAPGTTYEYWAIAGSAASTIVSQFTTEPTTQLANSSFEYWTDGTPMLIYGSGQSLWWDSGNHGSSSANINITTYSEEYKHSGNFSAKLESKKAGLMGVYQFAAGNLFAGKYVKTEMDGVRGNGTLGWGRPFTSRPVALKGYIRYIPNTVNMTNNCSYISEGDMDKGQIYIALGNWVGESANGETWPVIIKTNFKNGNNAKLFDPNDTSIIAYGEKTWDAATEGDDMIEFRIPIEYRSTDTKPTNIILVASSSKYGDYFTGGIGSTMWLDDLELVYE
nr:DUF4493 domain-containing protein [uncultured Bacteroides sp.]